jgi:hypothetical protein
MSARRPIEIPITVKLETKALDEGCADWRDRLVYIENTFEEAQNAAVMRHSGCPAVKFGEFVFPPYNPTLSKLKMLVDMRANGGWELLRDEPLEDGRWVVELGQEDPDTEPIQGQGYCQTSAFTAAWAQVIDK